MCYKSNIGHVTCSVLCSGFTYSCWFRYSGISHIIAVYPYIPFDLVTYAFFQSKVKVRVRVVWMNVSLTLRDIYNGFNITKCQKLYPKLSPVLLFLIKTFAKVSKILICVFCIHTKKSNPRYVSLSNCTPIHILIYFFIFKLLVLRNNILLLIRNFTQTGIIILTASILVHDLIVNKQYQQVKWNIELLT